MPAKKSSLHQPLAKPPVKPKSSHQKKAKSKPASSQSLETKKLLAGAGLAGSLLLSSGSQKIKSLPEKPPELRLPYGLVSSQELKQLLAQALKKVLPSTSRVLTQEEEDQLSQTIAQILGVKAVAQLDGNRLNHQIGLMGLEQNILRFPGDTLSDRKFPQAGMAPGKAAWGYFAPSQAQLTAQHVQMEKYYLAVQTLYLPDWNTRLKELRDWYRYRKVLVINPDNGAAVVAVVADSGPAKWTGKQFGGSPEVMHELDLYPRRTKGQVIVLFLDDPDNQIPLGPVDHPFNAKKLLEA